jgi:CRP/FNR family cyclic AMP-dependent transcriptional regulator
MPLLELLAGNRLFQGVEPAALDPVIEQGSLCDLADGQVLIREGEANSRLYFVLEGELEVSLPVNPKRFTALKIARCGPGACIGEYAFVDGKPASATVTAAGSARLFQIEDKRFRDFLSAHPEIGRAVYRNLLEQLVERLRAANAELDLFRPV